MKKTCGFSDKIAQRNLYHSSCSQHPRTIAGTPCGRKERNRGRPTRLPSVSRREIVYVSHSYRSVASYHLLHSCHNNQPSSARHYIDLAICSRHEYAWSRANFTQPVFKMFCGDMKDRTRHRYSQRQNIPTAPTQKVAADAAFVAKNQATTH